VAILALLASLHVWSVCLVLDRPEGRSWALFVLSVALAAWTHFFGLSLIGVDVFVGVVLRATGRMERARARTWIFATLAALLLALPVFPIFEFYLRQERPYAIVEVHDRLAYALWAARSLFKATATYRVDVAPFAWLSLYVALGVLGWAAWRKPRARDASEATNPTGLADAGTRALIALAACLPGMPAAQLWSFVSGSAVFERYALTGGWAQPIALVLAWWFVFGRTGARLFAATLLAFGLVRFAGFAGVYAAETHDWTPVVEHIEKRAGPGDAYFVQDFDQWTGPAAFDGLWNERYGRGLLGLVHGAPLRRAAIPREGLTLDSAPAEVRRLWVFSHLFASEWLEHMPREHAAGWRLRELTVIGRAPPLALFERAD
jgi:hypothetical protein